MRILHVAESVKGGCGTYLNQLVQAQLADPAIQDVRAILPEAHLLQVPDIPPAHRALFAGEARSRESLLALWRAIAQELRTFRPDCIHLHSTFAGAIGRVGLALRVKRPAVIYCAHGWAFDMGGARYRQWGIAAAERVLSHACDGIVAISDHERRRGIEAGIPAERIVTVLNGITDAPPPPPARPATRRRVLFIGRLDQQKGIDILLRAIAGLSSEIELRVIGTSVVGDGLAVPAETPGVKLLGWCNEARIREELAWSDMVVVPSRWEGFGLVALEAMRAGRAVVATRVGGLPEVVQDQVTGWLVPPEDPAALRKVLLAPSGEQLAAAGAAGRRRYLERFTIERMATELSEIYSAAIRSRGGPLPERRGTAMALEQL